VFEIHRKLDDDDNNNNNNNNNDLATQSESATKQTRKAALDTIRNQFHQLLILTTNFPITLFKAILQLLGLQTSRFPASLVTKTLYPVRFTLVLTA
jgi:hypothetical protein